MVNKKTVVEKFIIFTYFTHVKEFKLSDQTLSHILHKHIIRVEYCTHMFIIQVKPLIWVGYISPYSN